MNKTEEEIAMVRKMKDSGMTLAEVARELEKSISWVYSRYNDCYIPAKAKTNKKDTLKSKLIELEERKAVLGERRTKLEEEETGIEGEINCPSDRSYEELLEYRKKRDKDVDIAGAVPEFDSHYKSD